MMCEAIGLNELKEDSTAYVSGWVKRHIWDLPVEVPYVPRRRRVGYVVYALLSGVYSYTVLYILARFVGNVFRNFDPDWSFIPELVTAAFIFRSRIRSLVTFMKLVYLDKRDRVRSWAIFRHPLYLLGALAAVRLPASVARHHPGPICSRASAPRLRPRTRVPGSITQVYAAEGMQVAAGAPLLQMNNLALRSNQGKDRRRLRFSRCAGDVGAPSLLRLRLRNSGPRPPRRTGAHGRCPGCDSRRVQPDRGRRAHPALERPARLACRRRHGAGRGRRPRPR